MLFICKEKNLLLKSLSPDLLWAYKPYSRLVDLAYKTNVALNQWYSTRGPPNEFLVRIFF
jgi:hypothetical protein